MDNIVVPCFFLTHSVLNYRPTIKLINMSQHWSKKCIFN